MEKEKGITYVSTKSCLHLSRIFQRQLTEERRRDTDDGERYDLNAASTRQQREVQYDLF